MKALSYYLIGEAPGVEMGPGLARTGPIKVDCLQRFAHGHHKLMNYTRK